jgi:hypothetical protein
MDSTLPAEPAALTGSRDIAETWRAFFQQWPSGIPQRGVLVTTFDEQIPFNSFMIADELLYLERRNPDTLGSRAVILPFSGIVGLKITDVVESREMRTMGFKPVSTPKAAKSTPLPAAR